MKKCKLTFFLFILSFNGYALSSINHERTLVYSPTSDTTEELSQYAYQPGDIVTIVNNGTANLTVDADDASGLAFLFPGSSARLICVTDLCNDNSDWEGLTPIVSEWINFTPTIAWTTNATATARKRRVGDSLHLRVRIATTGTVDALQLSITLPNSLEVSQAKVHADTNNLSLGIVSYLDSGTGTYASGARVRYENDTVVVLKKDDNTFNQTVPIQWANGDEIYVDFLVPIDGWTSNKNTTPSNT